MLILIVPSPLFDKINENFSVFSGNLSSGTGVGIYDLPRYLTWSGLRKAGDEKPLFVALTHAHFDHSGEELFIENFFFHPQHRFVNLLETRAQPFFTYDFGQLSRMATQVFCCLGPDRWATRYLCPFPN